MFVAGRAICCNMALIEFDSFNRVLLMLRLHFTCINSCVNCVDFTYLTSASSRDTSDVLSALL